MEWHEVTPDDALSERVLERDEFFGNYRFRLTDGRSRSATTTEVLLWRISKQLERIEQKERQP